MEIVRYCSKNSVNTAELGYNEIEETK